MKKLLTLIAILFSMNAMAQNADISTLTKLDVIQSKLGTKEIKSQLPGGYNLAIGRGCLLDLTTQSYCICITDNAKGKDFDPPSDYYYHVDYNESYLQTPKGKIIAEYLKEFQTDGKPKSKIIEMLDYIRFVSSGDTYINEIGMIFFVSSAPFEERLVIGIQ